MNKSITINAVLNSVRQGLSIAFPLITFPYVSRTIGDSEFGRFSFSLSIISYFMLIATFGINIYGVREGARIRDDKRKIQCLISDLFTINLITSILAIVLLFFLIAFNGKVYEYRVLIYIQSLSILLTAIGVDWVNTIFEDYIYITVRYIIIQIVALVLILCCVNSPQDVYMYSLIMVFGSYGGNIVNIAYIRRYVTLRINLNVDIKKYVRPLLFLFVNSLATVIYVNSDITMLGGYTTDSDTGIYSLSSKIYNMVKYLINSVLIVYVPRLAYVLVRDYSEYNKYINSIINILTLLIFPCVALMFCLSHSIMFLVGGNQYVQGDSALQILSFSLIFALFSSVTSNCILIINRKENRCLIGTVTAAIINVLLNFILIPIIDIKGAAITTVLAELINMIIQVVYVKKDLNIKVCVNKIIVFVTAIEVFIISCACTYFNRTVLSDTVFGALERIIGAVSISMFAAIILFVLFKSMLLPAVNIKMMK